MSQTLRGALLLVTVPVAICLFAPVVRAELWSRDERCGPTDMLERSMMSAPFGFKRQAASAVTGGGRTLIVYYADDDGEWFEVRISVGNAMRACIADWGTGWSPIPPNGA